MKYIINDSPFGQLVPARYHIWTKSHLFKVHPFQCFPFGCVTRAIFSIQCVCSVRFFYLVILNWMAFILFTKMRVHIIELVFVWLAYGILVSADLTPSTEQSTPSVDVTSIKKVLSSHPEWFLDYFSTLTSNSIIFWLAEHCNILWITVSGQHRLYDESIGSIVWLIQKLYQHSVRTIWKSWSEYLSILT